MIQANENDIGKVIQTSENDTDKKKRFYPSVIT